MSPVHREEICSSLEAFDAKGIQDVENRQRTIHLVIIVEILRDGDAVLFLYFNIAQ